MRLDEERIGRTWIPEMSILPQGAAARTAYR
jgi:hypothetical protein